MPATLGAELMSAAAQNPWRLRDYFRSVQQITLTFVVAGLVGIVLYGAGTTTFTRFWALFGLSALLGGAALLAGGLLGFIFAIPRSRRLRPGKAAPPAPNAAAAEAAAPSPEAQQGFDPNTNLEEISDWLTKIIVGLGLAQLHKIPAYTRDFIAYVTGCAAEKPVTCAYVLALLGFFGTAGFLFGYLLTRIFMPGAFHEADGGRIEDLEHAVEDLRTAKVEGVGKLPSTQTGSDVAAPADDPLKGRWGRSATANGRELSATVTAAATHTEWFRVHLTVRSTDPTKPLEGSVVFHLHPTFRQSVRTAAVQNGEATLELLAYGAFTVGAEADGGATRLELDLAELRDAPKEFRAR